MIDIFCVWVKPKYTIEHVYKLWVSCQQNIKVPFRFICLTDRYWIREPIEFIDVDQYQLDTWWNKMLIFNPQYNKFDTCLYFDLDVKINRDITHIINEIDDEHLFVVDTPWKDEDYFTRFSHRFKTSAFLEYGNTSVMGWKKNSHQYLLGMFMGDIFKHTVEHYGDDTFINRNGNIKYFKSVSITLPCYYKDEDILINYKT